MRPRESSSPRAAHIRMRARSHFRHSFSRGAVSIAPRAARCPRRSDWADGSAIHSRADGRARTTPKACGERGRVRASCRQPQGRHTLSRERVAEAADARPRSRAFVAGPCGEQYFVDVTGGRTTPRGASATTRASDQYAACSCTRKRSTPSPNARPPSGAPSPHNLVQSACSLSAWRAKE